VWIYWRGHGKVSDKFYWSATCCYEYIRRGGYYRWSELAEANADGYTIGILDRKLLVKWMADNARFTKIVKDTGIARRIATHKN
jgi:hypothetical protein